MRNQSKNNSSLWGFGKVLAIVFIGFFCVKGIGFRAEQDNEPTIGELSLAAIERAQAAPTVIPLDKGVPVATFRLNGETYVIYTTNQNDRPR